MPFKSNAQRRKFYVLKGQGKITQKEIDEWEKDTPDNIPERVEKKGDIVKKAEFFEGFEKFAINLRQARRAYKATVAPHKIRASVGVSPIKAELRRKSKSYANPIKLKKLMNKEMREGKGPRFIRRLRGSAKVIGEYIRKGIPAGPVTMGAKLKPTTLKEKLQVAGHHMFSGSKAIKRSNKTLKKLEGKILMSGKTPHVDPLFVPKRGTRAEKEMGRRMVGLHEAFERRAMKRLGKGKQKKFHSHISPEVLLRENNLVATLPKSHKNLSNRWKNTRTMTGETKGLAKLMPGFEYGKRRYSRHAIKRMTEAMERKMK